MDIISDDALTSLHSKDKFLPFASAITAAALTAYAFYRRYYQESLNGIPVGLRGIPTPTAILPYAGKYNIINKIICSRTIFNSCVFDTIRTSVFFGRSTHYSAYAVASRIRFVLLFLFIWWKQSLSEREKIK